MASQPKPKKSSFTAKKFISLAAAFALSAGIFAGCGSSSDGTKKEAAAPKAKKHLRVAYSPSLCQAPLHIAVEKGFFAAEGIDAENIQVNAFQVQEAIGSGKLDAGFGLIGKFLQPMENGLPIKFTAGIHTGCIKVAVRADSGIKTVADLKGKKIGVPGLAGAEALVAKRALANAGLSANMKNPDAELVVISPSDLGQALQKGVIDAISLGDPAAAKFIDTYKLATIVDTAKSDGFKDEYCCGAFITNKLASADPELAAAFTRAILKASVWVQQNPEEAVKLQIEKKYVPGDPVFNTSIIKSYNYMPSVKGGYDAIQKSVAQLTDIGVLKSGTVAKDFADKSYLLFKSGVPDTYSPADSQAPSGKK